MIFFLFRKKCPQAGFELGTPTTNPDHFNALDRSAKAQLFYYPLSGRHDTLPLSSSHKGIRHFSGLESVSNGLNTTFLHDPNYLDAYFITFYRDTVQYA